MMLDSESIHEYASISPRMFCANTNWCLHELLLEGLENNPIKQLKIEITRCVAADYRVVGGWLSFIALCSVVSADFQQCQRTRQ